MQLRQGTFKFELRKVGSVLHLLHLRAMPQAQLMRLHARRLLTQGQTRAPRRDAGILLHALQRQVARALGSFLLPKGGVLPRRRQQRRRLR